MKTRFFLAFAATASLIVLSCNWFGPKKTEANPLVGEWKLDSVKIGKDTSLAYFFMAMAMHDSGGIDVSFTKDTIFSRSKEDVDTTAYTFDEKNSQVVTKDSTDNIFSFARVNDSLVTLTGKDSAVLFLHKK